MLQIKKTSHLSVADAASLQSVPTYHRVVVYVMNENEKKIVTESMKVQESMDGLMIGMMRQEKIEILQKQNIIVEDNGPVVDKSSIQHPSHSITVFPAYVKVKISGPITAKRSEQLSGTILSRTQDEYIVRVQSAQEIESLWKLNYVDSILATK